MVLGDEIKNRQTSKAEKQHLIIIGVDLECRSLNKIINTTCIRIQFLNVEKEKNG